MKEQVDQCEFTIEMIFCLLFICLTDGQHTIKRVSKRTGTSLITADVESLQEILREFESSQNDQPQSVVVGICLVIFLNTDEKT